MYCFSIILIVFYGYEVLSAFVLPHLYYGGVPPPSKKKKMLIITVSQL